MVSDKQLKASTKEGGKKGQDLIGMSDMGGVKFFSVAVDTANGSWPLMNAIMDGMNKDVDAAADDRKGGAGEIAKCLLGATDDVLLIICHVPDSIKHLIDQNDWFGEVVDSVGGVMGEESLVETGIAKGVLMRAEMKVSVEKQKFPLKERDVAIGKSFEYLVKKELVRPDESDDDENYAEMADIEW